jgi:hypothetical protein
MAPMSPARVYGLAVLIALAPVLGFAAGEPALRIWNKHPRHVGGTYHDDDTTRVAWKTTPGTATVAPPLPAPAAHGWLWPPAALRVALVAARPPFVPPRV